MNQEIDCRQCKHMNWCKDKHELGLGLTWQNCREGEKFEPKMSAESTALIAERAGLLVGVELRA